MERELSGIYQIKNIINGKIYIGSSKNIYKRWKTHISRLKYGNHCNSHLQSAWNKYGEDAFKFSILETTDNLNKLKDIEQYYIDTLQPFDDNGYNLCKSTKSYMFKRKMPEKWYKNIKKVKTPKHVLHMRYGNPKRKNIIAFNCKGKCLFTSISSGETVNILKENYNINAIKSLIIGCCNHKYYTVYGMIFLYENEYLKNKNILNTHLNHEKTLTSIKVVSISNDFLIIKQYDSIIKASNMNRNKASSISRCCSGKQYTCDNLYWLYYEDYIKNKDNIVEYIKNKIPKRMYQNIVQLDMRYNKKTIWKSLDEIIHCFPDYKRGTLMDCLRKKTASAYSYRWILYSDYITGNYKKLNTNGQAKTVLQLDLNHNIIKEWNSCSTIEKHNKTFKSSSIKSVCNGRMKTHKYKNYLWYYKEDYNELLLYSNNKN